SFSATRCRRNDREKFPIFLIHRLQHLGPQHVERLRTWVRGIVSNDPALLQSLPIEFHVLETRGQSGRTGNRFGFLRCALRRRLWWAHGPMGRVYWPQWLLSCARFCTLDGLPVFFHRNPSAHSPKRLTPRRFIKTANNSSSGRTKK